MVQKQSNFVKNLKELRKVHELTKKQLDKSMGFTHGTTKAIENGEPVGAGTIAEIAKQFEITEADLIGVPKTRIQLVDALLRTVKDAQLTQARLARRLEDLNNSNSDRRVKSTRISEAKSYTAALSNRLERIGHEDEATKLMDVVKILNGEKDDELKSHTGMSHSNEYASLSEIYDNLTKNC